MKKFLSLTAALLTAAAAFAADAVPAFNATLTTGKETRFVLIGADAKSSAWLKVGDTFDGYTIKAYDAPASALDLERDGKVTRVSLTTSSVAAGKLAATPATLTDAQSALNAMHFENMMKRTIDQQKTMVGRMLQQMSSRMNIPPESREDFLAFQKKVMDEVMKALDIDQLKSDAAQVFSKVYTKEELDAVSAFYSTPLGSSVADKQPDVQQKMQELMMPRMMAMMPKIQQMAQEFGQQQQAKAAAAAAAEPAAAATPAATPAAPKAALPAAPAATPKE